MPGQNILRRTKQRGRLFDLLTSRQEPMTADQILKICQLECPNMALTTVYRNLDRLVELGYAAKISSSQGAARYSVSAPERRIRLFCRECNVLMHVDDADIKLLEDYIYAKTGFEIENGDLEFYGVCRVCANRGG